MTTGNSNVHGTNESVQELSWPPGRAAQIAQFVYNAAPRPNREVAIATAIGLLAGICGRQWQVSNTGLNVYLILVARSATGKEAMHSGISALINAAAAHEPCAAQYVDFNDYASGQALVKGVAVNPCFVNVAGEWGHKFADLADRKTSSAMTTLRRAMTDLYMKSGAQSVTGGITYSNKENNISSMLAVSYSMLGETTPGTLYEAITPSMMGDGFMSRFTIIQYHGDRPDENPAPVTVPPEGLARGIAQLARHACDLQNRLICQPVAISIEGLQALDTFKRECDQQIKSAADDESRRQMWNRAHLKALRIAALLAVADNIYAPAITTAHAAWAITLIQRDIQTFTGKLDSGDIGDGDAARKGKVIALLLKYVEEPPEKYVALRNSCLAPDQYLQSRTQNVSVFKNHPLGANKALKQTVDALVEGGLLKRAMPDQVTKHVPKAKGTCYWLQELPGYEAKWASFYATVEIPWLKKQP